MLVRVYEVSEYLLGMNCYPTAGACKLQRRVLGLITHEGTEES